MSNTPRRLTRDQLAKFLPNARAIRAFEQVMEQLGAADPSDPSTLAARVTDASLSAAEADAKATSALDILDRIATALELLAVAPFVDIAQAVAADVTPPSLPQISVDELTLATLIQQAEDNVAPPASPVGTLGTQDSNTVSISGGNIDGTPIGQNSTSTGSFTTVQTSGNAGIGSAPVATQTLRVGANLTGGTIAYGVVSRGQVQSDVTVGSYSYASFAQFANFAAGSHKHYSAGQGTIGGTLSVQMGFEADSSLTGAATNYGYYSNLPSAASNWNFYANGTARNFFNGNTQIGSATPTAGDEKLQVNGALSINSAVMLRTYTPFTNGAGAGAGTLTNAPAAGNPTKWIPINDNGTTRYIPAW